jgi:hypothetical protein
VSIFNAKILASIVPALTARFRAVKESILKEDLWVVGEFLHGMLGPTCYLIKAIQLDTSNLAGACLSLCLLVQVQEQVQVFVGASAHAYLCAFACLCVLKAFIICVQIYTGLSASSWTHGSLPKSEACLCA